MTKNPFLNALFAISYIVILVSLASLVPTFFANSEDNIFMPMSALSALVLSVSVMAYLFFYQPVLMFLDGEREKGVKLFLHTVAIFACGAVMVFLTSIFINRFF